MIFFIVLPTLFPFMFAAVRVSFGVSWKVALTAELFGGSRWLGYTMNIARQELETQIYAVIALIVVIVFLATVAVRSAAAAAAGEQPKARLIMRPADLTRTVAQRAIADGLVLLALAVWWWSSRHLPASVIPSPQAVLARLVAIATEPALGWHALVTTLRVMASVLLSLVLGLALALAAHARPWLDGIITDRILVVLSGMPSVGWAILAGDLVQGIEFTVIFVQVMILLPFALINFAEGLRNLDQEVIEMADSFSTRRTATLVHVSSPCCCRTACWHCGCRTACAGRSRWCRSCSARRAGSAT